MPHLRSELERAAAKAYDPITQYWLVWFDAYAGDTEVHVLDSRGQRVHKWEISRLRGASRDEARDILKHMVDQKIPEREVKP